jgi:hypothetical protein
MNGNLYQKARGLSIIFFFIFLMAVVKVANFKSGTVTGAITIDAQFSIMGLLLVLTVFAGLMAVYFRGRFGF